MRIVYFLENYYPEIQICCPPGRICITKFLFGISSSCVERIHNLKS
uniref:Uncharacterized protein n=1 Tax=Rhizophora mucronata TaxID=61149 RepID=A0A2P2IV30_RHIMU